jgi:lauroyl/myristoyl acyltransferase
MSEDTSDRDPAKAGEQGREKGEGPSRRRRGKLLRPSRLKDLGLIFGISLLKFGLILPRQVFDGLLTLMGILFKMAYFLPLNPLKRNCRYMSVLTGGKKDPRRIYMRFIDNMVFVGKRYIRLHRLGPESLLEDIVYGDDTPERLNAVEREYGAAIIVVPHCMGAVLSSTTFARIFPTVLVVKESKSPTRRKLQKDFFDRMAVDMISIRDVTRTGVARDIVRLLRKGKFVVGTTDLAKVRSYKTVIPVFGEEVYLPSWPARFAIKKKVPIVPGYMPIMDDKIRILTGRAIVGTDIREVTAGWARYFESMFLEYPSDWAFLLDKRWTKILAQAAGRNRSGEKGSR